jgi:hypothetical protein
MPATGSEKLTDRARLTSFVSARSSNSTTGDPGTAPATTLVQPDLEEADETMSASSLLVQLWQRGVILRLSDDRSRIVVPRSRLTPELRERLLRDMPELLKLLAFVEEYRGLIRNAFAVMVHTSSARKVLREFADDQARLTDELGPTLTSTIRDYEAREWRRETGLCPVCADDNDCDMCRETQVADPDPDATAG